MLHSDILCVEDVLNMPLMQLPIRSTIIRTKNGLIIFSPTKNLGSYQQTIDKMGSVKAVVSPSLFHHLYVKEAKECYPKAKLIGAQGLAKKRPDVSWDAFCPEGLTDFQEDIEVISLEGMPNFQENVFFHKPSKTLLVSDLCFNLTDAKGLGSWLILNLFGTYRKFGVSRLFLKFVTDKDLFVKSIRHLMTLDFQNIIPGHGYIVVGNAKEMLVKALEEKNIKLC